MWKCELGNEYSPESLLFSFDIDSIGSKEIDIDSECSTNSSVSLGNGAYYKARRLIMDIVNNEIPDMYIGA